MFAVCFNSTSVQKNDFSGNRQPKACAPCVGNTGFIQTVKFIEQGRKTFRRNCFTFVLKYNGNKLFFPRGRHCNFRIWVAIRRRIFQYIAKYTGYFFRVCIDFYIFVKLQ